MSKKVIERNHKVEKVEKYSFNGLMDMLSRLNGKLNYSNYFGDSRVGNRIINEITLKKVPGKVVNERISYIFNIFKLNGYSDDDAKEFIINNPNLIETNVKKTSINYTILNFIANKSNFNVIDLIKSDKANDTLLLYKPSNIYGVYHIICDMFSNNGYDENDAYFYLTTNKNILKLSVDSLLNKLSILYEAGMLEEVFFNHPDLLTEVISDKDLYEQYTKKSIKDMNYSEFKLILDSLKNNFTNHLYENSEQVLSIK